MCVAVAAPVLATEFHVSVNGKDDQAGTAAAPLRTIQRAADLAQPGDAITVHAGIYRERVNPPRGGESEAKRIVYQAAPGEKVEIRGSEVIRNWERVQGDVWKVTLPNSFFGNFNPYSDLIYGDWFGAKNRQHHTGAVYLNGEWLVEAATIGELLNPITKPKGKEEILVNRIMTIPRPGARDDLKWFALVNTDRTTIWAQFGGVNPNEQQVEINVRRTVFYPDQPGRNYITVRGFGLRHAATPWAPPTSEQVGLIGTHWSRGWIIEDNDISHSVCTAVTLGKYGDEWDNQSANTAEGYVKTIERGFANGWNKATVGSHVVRNNTIAHCEQAGIVGSLGAVFSTVTGNTIHDIHVRRYFGGAEMAGIKFHGAIDTEISRNHIYNTCLAIWLDWMAQGTHVTRNLMHDNGEDLFTEVDHGPILVDNNIFLSARNLASNSQGASYVHNLFAGAVVQNSLDQRKTPYMKPHSTEVVALPDNPTGDHQFHNNVFVGRGDMNTFDRATLPMVVDGNVFFKGTKSCKFAVNSHFNRELDPGVKLVTSAHGAQLALTLNPGWAGEASRKLVTTELLGRTAISDAAYEQPDGSPLRIDTDYFGKPRNASNPTPGPFENPGEGKLVLIEK
jgi:alpha-N-arabinofuranosidase